MYYAFIVSALSLIFFFDLVISYHVYMYYAFVIIFILFVFRKKKNINSNYLVFFMFYVYLFWNLCFYFLSTDCTVVVGCVIFFISEL